MLLWCSRSLLGRIQPLHRLLSVIPINHLLKGLLEFHQTYLAFDQPAAQIYWFTCAKGHSHFLGAASMNVSHL